AAVALTAEDAEPLVELAEVLVHARLLVDRIQEEIVEPGDREAERGEPELVREGIPFGERERPERLIAGDEGREALQLVGLAVETERVHRRREVEDELATAGGLEIEHADDLVALEEQVVVKQVSVDDALRELVLEVSAQVVDLVVERADGAL